MNCRKIFVVVFLFVSLSSTATAAPYNYAHLWLSWNRFVQEVYIDGVTDGIAEAYVLTMQTVAQEKWLTTPEPPELANLREKLFVRDTRTKICDVISDLYKDPANSFIPPLKMFFLSRDKIEGKNISDGLMKARAASMKNYQINKK